MATTVHLEKNGLVTKSFIGFSWTTLFFGFFVPLFRGDWKWVLIMLVLGLCSFGLANFILCFLYNSFYTKSLLEKGYIPADDFSRNLLKTKGFIL